MPISNNIEGKNTMAILREITENLQAISGGEVNVLARVANEFDQECSRLTRDAGSPPLVPINKPSSQSTEPPKPNDTTT
jgi:hypothetical protein